MSKYIFTFIVAVIFVALPSYALYSTPISDNSYIIDRKSDSTAIEAPLKLVTLDSVVIRSHSKIHLTTGVQKTDIGIDILKENPIASMSDILSENASIFIKSYGRATLSTASIRGASASHTQVEWNGMNINSPMLGMVDFSYIPSYFIDNATVLYGASSTGFTGGGLGGAVLLGTESDRQKGFEVSYLQGVSSYKTFDQFLKTTYGGGRWHGSTRVAYTTSKNDFPYINYDKAEYITDENGNIMGEFYPEERNKNASYHDLHALQEIYFDGGSAGDFKLTGWFMDSQRGIPMLNVDRREESSKKGQQNERTLRSVAGWNKTFGNSGFKAGFNGGYTYSDILYTEIEDKGNGDINKKIDAQSYVNVIFGKLDLSLKSNEKWLFAINLDMYQNFVDTRNRSYLPKSPDDPIGYKRSRSELSGMLAVRYQPSERIGVATNIRSEICGTQYAPFIPSLFFDYAIVDGSLKFKASATRNYRFPTLNDLYFRPGGNPLLRPEQGFSYDGGLDYVVTIGKTTITGKLTAYDSYIKDWILWASEGGGYFTPSNIKEVHSYGIDAFAGISTKLSDNWSFKIDGKLTYTRSINKSDQRTVDDNSYGKQLPYTPLWASSLHGKLSYKEWGLIYKWNYYSERFTSTDNYVSKTGAGRLTPYFMSDIAVEKGFSLKRANISLRLAVNNLLNENYVSELSRPMPRRNFGFFIEITPKWH